MNLYVFITWIREYMIRYCLNFVSYIHQMKLASIDCLFFYRLVNYCGLSPYFQLAKFNMFYLTLFG